MVLIDYSRIDDYVILKGNISIGKSVHISSFSILTATNIKSSIMIEILLQYQQNCDLCSH